MKALNGNSTFKIMGILNVTPDSFSDGGTQFLNVCRSVAHAKQMVLDGADIIDVGGVSTRPEHTYGESSPVFIEEELRRVIPVIEALKEEVDVPISIDTYNSSVAEAAFQAGAHVLNDVWGLQRDRRNAIVAAEYNASVVIMHNQEGTDYKTDLIDAIRIFFDESLAIAKKADIPEDKIWLDPGFGFGKTAEHNFELMNRLGEIVAMGYPVLLGSSRKSTLGKILNLPVKELAEATAATSVMGMMAGVTAFRVHDIKCNYRALKISEAILGYKRHEQCV